MATQIHRRKALQAIATAGAAGAATGCFTIVPRHTLGDRRRGGHVEYDPKA